MLVVLFVVGAKHRGGCPWWDGEFGAGVVFAWHSLVFCPVGAPLVL